MKPPRLAAAAAALSGMLATAGMSAQSPAFATAWPVASGQVTSGFAGKHQGIDIAATAGTPVLAFAAGVVEARESSKACGEHLRLRHEGGATSLYCNLAGIRVAVGESVGRGTAVGEIAPGSDRRRAHLHFELKIGGQKVDPLAHLPRVPE